MQEIERRRFRIANESTDKARRRPVVEKFKFDGGKRSNGLKLLKMVGTVGTIGTAVAAAASAASVASKALFELKPRSSLVFGSNGSMSNHPKAFDSFGSIDSSAGAKYSYLVYSSPSSLSATINK